MKNNQILSLILVSVFAISTLISCQNNEETKEVVLENQKTESEEVQYSSTDEEAILKVIHNRKSVRKFTDEPVTKEDLTTIMKAGMAAPTGFDARPWQFIAITDKATMLELREELSYATALENSPAAIVVCGDMSKVRDEAPEFWITDASAATQNMLLAIEGMGLGGVWCTLYPGEERMEHARTVLNLPDYIMPLAVIPIGHPTGVEKPKDKFDSENIHWEKW